MLGRDALGSELFRSEYFELSLFIELSESLKLLKLVSTHLVRSFFVELGIVNSSSNMGRNKHGWDPAVLEEVCALGGLSDLASAVDIVQSEFVALLELLLEKVSEIEAELAVDLLCGGVKEVVVEGAPLHNALSRFHRNPDLEVFVENVRVELLLVDIGLLSLNSILHREHSLLSLVVRLQVEQTAMVLF